MKKVLIIIQLLFCFQLSSQETNAKQWQEDLRFLQNTIHKDYSFVFVKTTKEDFDAQVETLYKDIPDLQEHEIRVGFTRIISSFKYGHTQIPYGTVTKSGILPINLYDFNDGIYIEGVQKDHKKALGAKILKIGETPIEKALELVYPVVPVENEQYFKAYGLRFLISPEVLHAQGIIPILSNKVTLTLEKDGKVFTHEFTTIDKKDKPKTFNFTLPTEEWITARNTDITPLYLKHFDDKLYYFEYLEDKKTLYVRQSSVFNDPKETLAQFYKRMFEFIDSNNVEKLVYDVRLNGGGNNYNNLPLIKGLMARPNLNKKGNFYFIIGRDTFSACQNLTNEITRYTEAILVGEPTAENINFYGDARAVQLPNSKINAYISYLWWQDYPALENKDATVPSVPVTMSYDDYIQNKDVVLETALNFNAEGFQPKPMEYITQLYVTGQGAKLAQEIPRMVQDPRYAFCDFETELNKKGNILLESGRGPEIQGSIQVFSMIMQLYPNSAMTYKNLGKAYLKLGDTKKATELLNKAISLDTNGEQGKAAKEVLLQILN
ncbi:tetratricopeptide repeat protein [uncultured Aquimarina sp.]|uniref:tetratricopeptide repeat protein n=1 Tax=uncultured Aquimarina sp. TaxID=575652 RepID=UPI002627006C|nr:tetratricopeptide repeat protein [uncultured Aquimarina sp.]